MKKPILALSMICLGLANASAQNSFHFNCTDKNTRQDIGVSSGILTFGQFVNNCNEKYPENIDWDKILVGIGTKAPTATLHVNGPKGNTFRMTDGTEAAGYVLTSDANGVGTWQPASGGGGADADWYTVGTTTAPMNIYDDKYTFGHIGIGTATPLTYRLSLDSGMEYINGAILESNLSSTNFFAGGPNTGLQLQNGSDWGGMLLSQHASSDNNDLVIYFGDNPTTSAAQGNDLRFCFAQWTGAVHQFKEYMRLNAFGNFGIGTSTPTDKLTVFNGTTTGTYTTTGWVHSSDARLKTNVIPVTNAMEIVKKLNGVYYNWKGNQEAGRQVGFIAQDVKKVLPEVVTGKEGDIAKGETLGMAYQNIVPVLVEALKEKDSEIADMKKRLEQLEKIVYAQNGNGTKTDNAAEAFDLKQNVPNPFSSASTIAYTIPEGGRVQLDLFSTDGTKVQTLESSTKEKGSYSATIDGRNLTAGTYIYTLSLNGKLLSKKAIKL